MAEGHPPYYNIHPMRAIFMIPTRPPPKLANPADWSPEFISFLASCLIKKPKERPTTEQLLKHAFIKKARNIKAKKILQPLIQEAERLIKEAGSKEAAMGFGEEEEDDDEEKEKNDSDDESVEKRSGGSSSEGGSEQEEPEAKPVKKAAGKIEPASDNQKNVPNIAVKATPGKLEDKKPDDDDGNSTTRFTSTQVRPMKRTGTSKGNPFVAQFRVLLDEDEGKYSKMDIPQLKVTLTELDNKLEKDLKELWDTYMADKKMVAQIISSRPK